MNEIIDSATGEIITIQPTVMESMIRAEVDVAIATAKRYPRDIGLFKQSVARVIADPIVAAGCGYLVPRGKGIRGPSVRLAEIMAAQYGNLSVATRTIEIGERSVRIQAVAKDFETNYQTSMEVERSIMTNQGKRYDDTMIQTTVMAAQAIGYRNVVFKTIPREYVQFYYEQAQKIAEQDPKALLENRGKWVAHFEAGGISRDRILARFGVTDLKNLSSDDVITMQGWSNAVRDGDTTIDEIFPPEESPSGELDTVQPKTWGDVVNDALKRSRLRKPEKDAIIRSGIADSKTAEEMLAIINIAISNKEPRTRSEKSRDASSSADADTPAQQEPATESTSEPQKEDDEGDEQGSLI